MSAFIKKVGKWDVAGLMTSNLKKDIPIELEVALKQVGEEGEKHMKKFIRGQLGTWLPLSPQYAQRKRNKGQSSKILLASTTMWQSITSQAVYPTVFIGVKRGKKEENGEDVANIAAIMEFGSMARNIPARPFIQPVSDYMKLRMAGNLFGRRILEYLRKKYGL